MLGRANNTIRYAVLLVATAALRLVQAVPNIEPVMATTLPVAKRFGPASAFVFALLAVASFDFISGRLGQWTIYTSIAYGAVGFLSGKYLAGRTANRKNFLKCSIAGTLAYDAATALLFGWQFGQPLAVTAIGQIPFTLLHLLGNIVLVAAFSPLIFKYALGERTPAVYAATDSQITPCLAPARKL